MDISEAIALIAETNEPLAVALTEIIKDQKKLEESQRRVVEALILHLITPPGKSSTIDLSFLLTILKGN